LQLQKQEIKKTKEKDTHNVSKSTTCQMHTNYAQRKRKITVTLKIDDTVTHKEHTKLINNNCDLSKILAKAALRSWRAV